MTIEIRRALAADCAAMAAIYAPAVTGSAVSFELVPPDVAEFTRRFKQVNERYPWYCAVEDGRVVGYAYAFEHRSRPAYQWSVDVSVYVDGSQRGKGVGKALYQRLFARVRELGYYNVYAGITLPNPASVALHESMSMTPVGVYRSVGFKLGAWHDVGWWQGTLRDHDETPTPPRSE